MEIAAVVVFKVFDTAAALFEVDDYLNFVQVQSEAGVRHVASQYPYDSYGKGGYSSGNTPLKLRKFYRRSCKKGWKCLVFGSWRHA